VKPGFQLNVLVLFLLAVVLSQAQAPLNQAGGAPQAPPGVTQIPALRPDYVLGANDQVLIRAPQAEEINERPYRVDQEGFITLPLVGRIRAEGLTVQNLETEVANKLREYIREPLVSITVTQFRTEPVIFQGAFRAPGFYALQGRRTLVEMMTAAGGLQPYASRRIKVTRRAEYGKIPLPQAVEDPARKISTVEIGLESLTQNINPDEDLVLQAYDVVSVDRAERVYVSGEVTRQASIELGERDSISIVQALTEAGGFTPKASKDHVEVLRPVLGTNRRAKIDIDMKRVLEGKDLDFPLLPNDALIVQGKKVQLGPVAASIAASLPYIIITALLR
jgi:polysaccharide export outer membrane protein